LNTSSQTQARGGRGGGRRSALVVASLLLSVPLVTACDAPSSEAFTIAMTASSAEPAPWSPAIGELAAEHARAAVEPGDGEVHLIVAGVPATPAVDLTPLRGNDVEQDPEYADEKITAKLPVLQAALEQAAAGEPGSNPLAVLDRAVQATPEGGSILWITSGVSTQDPTDLRRLGGWDFDVDALVSGLGHRGLIPDATGRKVILAGVGITLGSQPTLTIPARVKLTDTWLSICKASGAVSCTLLEEALPLRQSAATQPVPVVEVQPEATSCQGRIVVPADDVTFAADSATLTAAADEILSLIVDELKSCPAGRIATFTGHTARVDLLSSTGHQLSAERATAVRTRLAELGVPANVLGPAEGVGDTQPLVDNMPGGVFSEPLAALNRRVEVQIAPTEK
jgi:outer membrane protein OmpA-like peptidoglycan-associated protein